MIPQDPTIFKGSIRFNLDPMRVQSDEAILSLLEEAQLKQMLSGSGLDFQVSENGSNLSTGEKQLICICRAILRKSKVVILDEATSNIDIVTEQKIQSLIDKNFKDSTMLVVAHRLNTVIHSDKVLVLSFGKVLEFDSPQALMSDRHSEFSKLVKELKAKENKE